MQIEIVYYFRIYTLLMRLKFYLLTRILITKSMTLAIIILQFLMIFNKVLKLRTDFYKIRHFIVLIVIDLIFKSLFIDFL